MTFRPLGSCVIVNAYSYHNAGDAAIMLASKRLLTDLGATDVVLSTRYQDAEYADRMELLPELLPFPVAGARGQVRRAVTFGVGALTGLAGLAIARVSQRAARELLLRALPGARRFERCDTLIIAGGGYMYSARRRINLSLWHSMLTVQVGRVLTEQTLMMPQSIGPLHSRMDRELIQASLRGVDVVVRETDSLRRSTRRPRFDRVSEIPDVAFYSPDHGKSARVARLVRVVVMDWRWSRSASPEGFARYLDATREFARGLVADGFDVVFGGHSKLPEHDQDDTELATELAESVPGSRTDTDVDVEHLYREYARSAVVVSTRLHGAIMSWSVGTPALAIGYQEKARGTFALAGLEEYCLDADRLDSSSMRRAFDALIGLPPATADEVALTLSRRVKRGFEALLAEVGGPGAGCSLA